MTPDQPPIIVAGEGPVALAILQALAASGQVSAQISLADPEAVAQVAQSPLAGLVVVAPPPQSRADFLQIDDADLEAGLGPFLDLFGALGVLSPAVIDGGAVVYVGHRGHLGTWGGTHEAAFSGAVAGLMRALALETMGRGLRANVVATDLADDQSRIPPEIHLAQVADLTLFLLSPAAGAVSGELFLANRGASLRPREARNRTPKEVAQ